MGKIRNAGVILLLAVLGCALAQADDASEPSLFNQFQKKTMFSYWGYYRGAALGTPGNPDQPGLDGNPDPTAAQGIENELFGGYRFVPSDPDWVVGMVGHFYENFASQQASGSYPAANAGIVMLDPMLMLQKANLIKHGNFSVKGFLYALLPISSYDYISAPGHHMITELEPGFNTSWDIPDSRWNVGVYGYLNLYFGSSQTPDGLRTYKLYLAPHANYQFTPTFGLALWFDLVQLTRNGSSPFFSTYGMSNYETDIEPGFEWDILPGHLSVVPSVNFYPGEPTLSATSYQCVIIGKLW